MPTLSTLCRAVVWGHCAVGSLITAADATPRIVGLATKPQATAEATIREPVAEQSRHEPSAAVSARRSTFVPIAVPDPPPAIANSPIPQFSEQPQFTAPERPVEPTEFGPVLASPTASSALPGPTSAPPGVVNQPPATSNMEPSATSVSQHQVSRAPAVTQGVKQAAMQPVVQRAMQKADQAATMAQRGMLYSARAELVQALQLIAHALDAQQAGASHASALAAGLTAVEEARDFAGSSAGPSEDYQVQAVAAGHRTRAFAEGEAISTSPIAAQQKYLSLAQGRFIEAAGQVPAASQILYRLGRLETAMAAHDADPLALHGPQAIVFHQAALATDPSNWLAANELGVLYARYGQLDAAKQLLLASVTAHPHIEGWQNLAAVHRGLGETDLAQRAERERQLLAAKPGVTSASANAAVQWVDTKTFAASGGSTDVKWPADVANKAVRR